MTLKNRLVVSALVLFPIIAITFMLTGCKKVSLETELVIPLGLKGMDLIIPEDNLLTKEKIDLGRQLYFDERLSADGTVSCAFCHNPSLGFSDGRYFAMGVLGQKGRRNSATIINRVFSQKQYLDGRAANIEQVILDHIQNPNEMNNSIENLIETLSLEKKYREAFKAVFGSGVTAKGISKSIASFVRTFVSGNSPYDKFLAGDDQALSVSAQRGQKLFFSDRLNCRVCHSGPNFTDEEYHNNGAGQDLEIPDLGVYDISKNNLDKGKFKTPTLRNIARTSPYFHNGSIKSLGDVVEYYNKGGIANSNLSDLMKPLQLNSQEKSDLVNFLRSLTGGNILFMGNL